MKQHFGHELDAAQTIALQALAFLMSEPTQIAWFCDETGMTLEQIRENIDSADLARAVLHTLLSDEASLLTFTTNAGLRPDSVAEAFERLSNDQGSKRPMTSI